ncbi:LuxR family two component transcriptional regulator [Halopolyspora algeriensis]|uniref:LuxR family two component transcriptional regulator n=1 Tax=Halopolyspora algeriensis TaxID=1500506 RepID=A0A368VT81_9ACTN|nr:response regulator transcription factor [Halopolyspora algeriensis]RCW44416.1 LuxR family two component transcriptional regulator [Halopolyspora algeriensis]TQM55777.1 LuxR family two component transcriptional regulator [Halopolyspora algeriensis]
MVDLVLGDDHAVFVDALSAVLPRNGFTVLATAGSAQGTVADVRRHRPDLCLLDRYFADGDGLDVIGDVLAAGGGSTKVVMLTADRDARGMQRALTAGAAGYVNKMCGVQALVTVLRRVANGDVVTDPAAVPQRRPSRARPAPPLMAPLTGRERECLGLLVAGASTGTMAEELGVSATTVRTHVQALLTKLGVHSRLEAATFAVRHHLLAEAEIPRSRSAGGALSPEVAP